MNQRFIKILTLTLGYCAIISAASAQSGGNFTLAWSTFDGGGGVASGGGFTVNGTGGQPDAGRPMSGGASTITGGFWALPSAEPQPSLAIRHGIGNTVILTWPNPSTGYVLQQTANMSGLGGGWTDVTQTPGINGANKEVTLPAT